MKINFMTAMRTAEQRIKDVCTPEDAATILNNLAVACEDYDDVKNRLAKSESAYDCLNLSVREKDLKIALLRKLLFVAIGEERDY